MAEWPGQRRFIAMDNIQLAVTVVYCNCRAISGAGRNRAEAKGVNQEFRLGVAKRIGRKAPFYLRTWRGVSAQNNLFPNIMSVWTQANSVVAFV